MDLSISETEQSQNSIPSGLYLWPVLFHRHLGNAHDWQLHSLQFAVTTHVPMVSFGLTRDLLLSGAPAQSRGSDKSGSNRFLCTIFTLLSPPKV